MCSKLTFSKLISSLLVILILGWLDESYAFPSYRTYDGSGNNQENPEWGSAGSNLIRLFDSQYTDGINTPAGIDKPSARAISNAVSAQPATIPNPVHATSLLWQWGQFLDHDITLTHIGKDSFNISVPRGDEYFDPHGTGAASIALERSEYDLTTGINTPREQVNSITAFIDGSNIYGSSEERANELRAFEGGRLITSEGNLLPYELNSNMFASGDERVNEQLGLISTHTLFMREHNRIADQLSLDNPTWTDEQIFQESRRFVIAEMQSITFNEFLPLLIGSNNIQPYNGYDPSVNPSISNEFATAAFRVGHTMLPPELLRLDEDGNVIESGNINLRDGFFSPDLIKDGGIDPILRGLSTQYAQKIDTMISDDLRNFLFGQPGAGGFDLASLNIQRGRDHGLPGYNDARVSLGFDRIDSFESDIFLPGVGERLASVYASPDDIDLWVGGLSEQNASGSMLGELFTWIIGDQFTRLRDGDRFWYLNTLTAAEILNIESLTLSDIIMLNTDIDYMQKNALLNEVPEPTTFLLLGFGVVAGRLRRNFKDKSNFPSIKI